MQRRARLLLLALAAACACTGAGLEAPQPTQATPVLHATACALRVHVYDVRQGLSALVDLPDGRRVLVDAGDDAHRPKCGPSCALAHGHLIQQLRRDLPDGQLDLLWITHQHSDHIGGASDVLHAFRVDTYVDNGRDPDKPEILTARSTAVAMGTRVLVVDPEHRPIALQGSAAVRVTPIVPSAWPASCEVDPNQCSIALRIDACATSVLFTGDAGLDEEPLLDPGGPAALLQVGHHGSDTSSGDAFLARVAPRAAVISAGHEGEGVNRTYCHPRSSTIERLTSFLGGPGAQTLRAFDAAVSCRASTPDHWVNVPASDRIWATERDGDVVLVSQSDGSWARE